MAAIATPGDLLVRRKRQICGTRLEKSDGFNSCHPSGCYRAPFLLESASLLSWGLSLNTGWF